MADIDFYVYDTCPPGGGEKLVAADVSDDLRMRMNLQQGKISGRCLEMRAYARYVPSVTYLWSADYFHSGDPLYH